jgi:hypothetical protein
MLKTQSYECSICGAEIPNLPMPVLKHQMSHVLRRPFARDGRHPDRDPGQAGHASAPDLERN